MWYFIGFWVVCGIITLIGILRAPYGYEDENGFHYGKPEGEKK